MVKKITRHLLHFLLLFPDLYYGGESLSLDQPQSFTCPYCGKMGYTEVTLQEHVTADHADSTNEVVRLAFYIL